MTTHMCRDTMKKVTTLDANLKTTIVLKLYHTAIYQLLPYLPFEGVHPHRPATPPSLELFILQSLWPLNTTSSSFLPILASHDSRVCHYIMDQDFR